MGVGSTTRAARSASLTAAKQATYPWAAAILVLYQNALVPGQNTVIGDLTLCDFDGYAASSALTFSGPFVLTDGTMEIVAPSVAFIATGATTPNVVYGWALRISASGALMYAENFDTPIPISQSGDGLVVIPRVSYGA
jgi:hypothetical protein